MSKGKLSICLDGRAIINKNTGIGRYIYSLIEAILAVDTQNQYTLLVNSRLSSTHPVHQLDFSNLEIRIVNVAEVSVGQQFLLPIKLANSAFDIFHYPNFDLPVCVPFKSLMTIHDLTYVKHRDIYHTGRLLKNLYTRQIINLGIRRARKIIAVSKSTRDDLIELFNVHEEKIEVIYESIPGNMHLNFRPEPKCKLSTPYDGFENVEQYFLFVGERRPHKNLVRLIEAFALFKKNNPGNIKLVIGGKPYADYREPERKAEDLGVTKDVLFIGYVEDQDLAALYQNALTFVFVSIYEGFGIPILEAMACGTPVITGNISSMPEIAGDAALTIDPFNVQEISQAMLDVTRNATLRRQLIEKGLKRAAQFSWEKAAESTVRLYETI